MSETHTRYKFTVYLARSLGGYARKTFYGTSSSQQGGELLIHDARNGRYTSINYARVGWMEAEPLEEGA